MDIYELAEPRLDALRSATRPEPRAERGEVLVRLRAASFNVLDLAVATGKYPGVRFPLIPVADGVGEIAALGEGVDGWSVGDRVIPHFMPAWQDGLLTPTTFRPRRGVSVPGSLAGYATVPAASLVAIPGHLDFEQAATLPVAATTAWRAVRSAALGPQSTALMLGTGGVSIFALQFAKAHGARVIITSSSDEKLERARKLGADLTVNDRRTPDWDAEVLRLTDGRGADLVLETGGTATFALSVNAAAIAGTVFVIGFLTGTAPTIDVLKIMEKELRVLGNNTGPVAALREVTVAMAAHRLMPVIDRSFAFAQAREAYAYLERGGHFGKLAITIDRGSERDARAGRRRSPRRDGATGTEDDSSAARGGRDSVPRSMPGLTMRCRRADTTTMHRPGSFEGRPACSDNAPPCEPRSPSSIQRPTRR